MASWLYSAMGYQAEPVAQEAAGEEEEEALGAAPQEGAGEEEAEGEAPGEAEAEEEEEALEEPLEEGEEGEEEGEEEGVEEQAEDPEELARAREQRVSARTEQWTAQAVEESHDIGLLGNDLSIDVDAAMIASMAALTQALAAEETVTARTAAAAPAAPPPVIAAQAEPLFSQGGASALLNANALLGPNAGGILSAPAPLQSEATNWDELEARMAALANAIDGDAQLQPILQDAARLEARAARMRAREAKREAKRMGLAPGPLLGSGSAGGAGPGPAQSPLAAALAAANAAAAAAAAPHTNTGYFNAPIQAPSPLLSGATAHAAKLSMTATAAQQHQREFERKNAEEAERKAEIERKEAKEKARREAAALEAAAKAAAAREKAEKERAAKASKEAEKASKRAAQVERENRESGSAPNLRRALASGDSAAFRVQLVACTDRSAIGTSRLPCMIADGAAEVVLTGLSLLQNDPEALVDAFNTVRALAKADDRKRMRPFCEKGVQKVREVMGKHPGHPACQAAGFGALSTLVVHVPDKAAVSMDAMNAMAESPDDEELAIACCAAMRNGALGEEKNREEAAEFGALEALLEVLNLHAASPRVCEQACWALKNLCVLPSSQTRLAEQGGIEVVLGVLRAHSRAPATCEQAVWALRILAFNPENAATIQAAGGVTLVIDVQKVHIGHAGVQETCCGALRTFAALPTTRSELAEGGAAVRAVAAMRRHPESAAVQMAAAGLLSGLAYDQEWQRRTVSAGAVEVLVEAARAHPRATKLLQACFIVLVTLAAANSETKARAAAAGAVEVAVSVLEAQAKLGPETPSPLAEAALETVASVVSTPQAQRTAMEVDSLKAILAVMRIHRNVPEVAEKGCRAVSSVVWCLPPAQKAARKLGLLNDLMAVLNNFQGHRGVQKAARALMSSIQVEADDEADKRAGGGNSRTEPGIATLSIRNPNPRYSSL